MSNYRFTADAASLITRISLAERMVCASIACVSIVCVYFNSRPSRPDARFAIGAFAFLYSAQTLEKMP